MSLRAAAAYLSTTPGRRTADFGHRPADLGPIPCHRARSYGRDMTSTSSKPPLAAVTDLLCFVLVVGGGSGLLYEWLGLRIRVLGFVRFLAPDGYEIYAYIVMVVLGLIVGAAGDAVFRRGRG